MMKRLVLLLILTMGFCAEMLAQGPVVQQDPVLISDDEELINPDGDLGPPPGNPFVLGKVGNWRVKRSYVLQVGRTQTRKGANDNVNLREDGIYDQPFNPFWNIAPDPSTDPSWIIDHEEEWTFTMQINHYNPFGGFEVENVNPLGIHAASVYGYNYTLPVYVGGNAKIREIGFDSFEDYMFGRCANNHFSFVNTRGIENMITDRTSHTGRYSIRLLPEQKAQLIRHFPPCQSDAYPGPAK